MIPREQIINWLIYASLKEKGMSEMFYYDRRDNAFFSVMMFDYWLFNEDLTIADNVTSSYSQKDLNILADKIRRIDKNDPTITMIPGISSKEMTTLREAFISTLSDQKIVDLLYPHISVTGIRDRFRIFFEKEADEETVQKWEEHKFNYFSPRIMHYLAENNINIDTVTLWPPEGETNISIDLTKDK